MGKILITGASGTVGSQIAELLLEQGADVRIALRAPEKGEAWAARGAEVVAFDWDNDEDYPRIFEGIERAFLLTPFVEAFVPYVEKATRAATAAGARHLVRMSAIGADPNADGIGQDHGQAEELVKASGLTWTVLQPTFFVDNAPKYQLPSIQGEGSFYGASASQGVSYVSTADIAAVATQALQEPDAHQGQTYLLTGPAPVSDEDIASTLGELRGQPVQYVDLPAEQYAGGLRAQGTPGWMVDHMVFFENIKAQGWAAEVSPAVEAVLGRAPESASSALKRYQSALRG